MNVSLVGSTGSLSDSTVEFPQPCLDLTVGYISTQYSYLAVLRARHGLPTFSSMSADTCPAVGVTRNEWRSRSVLKCILDQFREGNSSTRLVNLSEQSIT